MLAYCQESGLLILKLLAWLSLDTVDMSADFFSACLILVIRKVTEFCMLNPYPDASSDLSFSSGLLRLSCI